MVGKKLLFKQSLTLQYSDISKFRLLVILFIKQQVYYVLEITYWKRYRRLAEENQRVTVGTQNFQKIGKQNEPGYSRSAKEN